MSEGRWKDYRRALSGLLPRAEAHSQRAWAELQARRAAEDEMLAVESAAFWAEIDAHTAAGARRLRQIENALLVAFWVFGLMVVAALAVTIGGVR